MRNHTRFITIGSVQLKNVDYLPYVFFRRLSYLSLHTLVYTHHSGQIRGFVDSGESLRLYEEAMDNNNGNVPQLLELYVYLDWA